MHFVRDRVPFQDFPGKTEEEYLSLAGGELDHDATAFEVLLAIIRLGGITPGYSFRNDRTTIYGGSPAVCVTEMPLYSFADYARSQKDNTKVSAYGIAFLKTEFYDAGGRPAIYGLSRADIKMVQNDPRCRTLPERVLPLAEQYRYVAYNPSGSTNWIDWSHEREWRWIPQDKDRDEIWVQDHNLAIGPTPALPIFKGRLDGRPFSKLCIIVWTKAEAERVQELLTAMYLAGSNNYDTPFDTDLIRKSNIIILSDVITAVESGNLESQTIEGLEAADLLEPIKLHATPSNAAKIANDAIKDAAKAADLALKKFAALHGEGSGSCGFAHAVTESVTNPIVQYMIQDGLASRPLDGRVWINFPYPFSQSLDYQEAACAAAAKSLSKSLGIDVWVQSRLD
jgi:hypothetical protein